MRKKSVLSNSVKFQPDVSKDILTGINKLVGAIRPTVGPLSRKVAISSASSKKNQIIEFPNSGGVIAKRIYQVEHREENIGVMMMRHTLCSLLDKVGDGTATAALLYQKIFSDGWRYLMSGGNPVRLRYYLEEGMHVLLDWLSELSIPFNKNYLNQTFFEHQCQDTELASMFWDIVSTMGEYGHVVVQPSQNLTSKHQYIRGHFWNSGLHHQPDGQINTNIELHDSAILISDIDINEASDLFPLLDIILSQNIKSIVLVANSISENALSLLQVNQRAGKFKFMVVKPPYYKIGEHFDGIEDLSILSGGKPLLKIAGDRLSQIQSDYLGYSRKAWVNKEYFGIVGGNGRPQDRKKQFEKIQNKLHNSKTSDDQDVILKRLGNIFGGTSIMYISGKTDAEINMRLDTAKRCLRILRSALSSGLLPGAGSAYLACRIRLTSLSKVDDEDQKAALRILYDALEVPARIIAQNSGYDANKIVNEFYKHYSPNMKSVDFKGFDVMKGKVVNLVSAGIVDTFESQRDALLFAVMGASQALSVDVIIHPKKPSLTLRP